MMQVGNINVSAEELRKIRNECEICGNDLRNELMSCYNQLQEMFNDGWDSDSGYKLAQEFEQLANGNFNNYLSALESYGNFCEETIAKYEAAESERKQEITAGRLQQLT